MAALQPLFQTGQVVVTRAALALCTAKDISVKPLLQQHVAGLWGLVSIEDAKKNMEAVQRGFRIVSKYETKGETFYIITEADRSSTCILLPEDY